jgi:hypothetical protein
MNRSPAKRNVLQLKRPHSLQEIKTKKENLDKMSNPSFGYSAPLLSHGVERHNKRLSIQQCRRTLGRDCTLTDSEIESLRDQMYFLADVVLDAFQQTRISSDTVPVSSLAA